jgi:UDP-glucose 4-epimerase
MIMDHPPTILLTGAAGYIGRILSQKLALDVQAGNLTSLVCADLRETPAHLRLPGVVYEQADVRDGEGLKALMQQHQPTAVVHLAAVLDAKKMSREVQYDIDVRGTKHVVEACLHAGVQRLLVSSSGSAYGFHPDNAPLIDEEHPLRGNPVFAYSDHKRQVEEMLATYRESHPHLEQTILRLCTVLGKTTDNLITALFRRKSLPGVKGFDSPFVFIWDEDAAACFRHAIFSDHTGIFNVAGDGALLPNELAAIMGKPYRPLPPGLLRAFLRILKTFGLSSYGPEQVLFLQYRPVLDNRKMKKVLGFLPEKTSQQAFEAFWTSPSRI